MDSIFTIHFPIQTGDFELEFQLQIQAQKLISLSLCDKALIAKTPKLTFRNKAANIILLQLKNYFSTAVSFHSIQLAPQGTAFQKSVWHELSRIPVGETRTYGEIASKLNTGARAVGNACRRNPIQIIVPCHRVVSATGLGGYAGETEGKQLSIKSWLLNHEGVQH